MSYDLWFKYKNREQTIEKKQFDDYFSRRPNYHIDEDDAPYQNEDTGVYFLFTYEGDRSEEDSDSDTSPLQAPVSFNINYFRPTVFALEALRELEAFVGHFDLEVIDNQMEGMGEGPFTADGFLSGWNAGNKFAIKAILGRDASNMPHNINGSKLKEVWTWNLEKSQLQERLGDDVFVPKVMFAIVEDKVGTIAVWPQGIPVRLPEVDYVYVDKGPFAPKKWLFFSAPKQVLVPFTSFKGLLGTFPRMEEGLPSYDLSYTSMPDSVMSFISDVKGSDAEIQGVPLHEIIDTELIKEYK